MKPRKKLHPQQQPYIFGELDAFQKLGQSAIDYTKQIMAAEHTEAPVGTAPVQEALHDLKHTAVGYALMMIFSENLLPVEEIQRIDDVLTARLNKDAEL